MKLCLWYASLSDDLTYANSEPTSVRDTRFLLETLEDMIYIPMTAYSLLLAGVKHSPHSAIDLSMWLPLNCGTIFQALSETPNL